MNNDELDLVSTTDLIRALARRSCNLLVAIERPPRDQSTEHIRDIMWKGQQKTVVTLAAHAQLRVLGKRKT